MSENPDPSRKELTLSGISMSAMTGHSSHNVHSKTQTYRCEQRLLPARQVPVTVQGGRQDGEDHHLHRISHLQHNTPHV